MVVPALAQIHEPICTKFDMGMTSAVSSMMQILKMIASSGSLYHTHLDVRRENNLNCSVLYIVYDSVHNDVHTRQQFLNWHVGLVSILFSCVYLGLGLFL